MNVRIEPSWHRVLEEEFEKFYFETLTSCAFGVPDEEDLPTWGTDLSSF